LTLPLDVGSIQDYTIRSAFEQIAMRFPDFGSRSIRMRFGTDTVAFTGGNTRSATKTVSHGLGNTPIAVLAVLDAVNGAGAGGPCNVTNFTATTFDVWATWASTPGGNFNQSFYWLALG